MDLHEHQNSNDETNMDAGKLWYYKSHAYRKWYEQTVLRWNLPGGHYFFSVRTASFSMEHGFQHGGRVVWVM